MIVFTLIFNNLIINYLSYSAHAHFEFLDSVCSLKYNIIRYKY